jgi:hypothetical protein
MIRSQSRGITATVIVAFLTLSAVPFAHATLLNVADPANILPGPGRTINVSSVVTVPGLDIPAGMIDNLTAMGDQDASFLFGQLDSPNRLSISGFSSAYQIEKFRIYTAADPTREPTSIAVRSSTSLVSTLNSGDYATNLGTFPFTLPITLTPYDSGRGYFDLTLAVPAPLGTQSLYMEMNAPISGIRIYELQALVPEPTGAAAAMFALACGSLLRRRSRNA